MAGLKFVCIAVVCMVLASATVDASISCGQVFSRMVSCISYVRGQGYSVPTPCCQGIRTLNIEAKTTPDRQAVCGCLKSTASSLSGIDYGRVASLPGKCGVTLAYKISPSTDCSRVK